MTAPRGSQSGASLLGAIFLIVVVGFFGLIIVSLVSTQNFSSVNELASTNALFIAEAGIERALYAAKAGTPCDQLDYVGVPLNPGTFTTASTQYNPASTTLTGAITNAVTTIPVVSTAGYAPRGRLRIESEEMKYAGIAGNTFTGVQRGAAGTAAAAHAINLPVSQNQCTIQSTGTVALPTVAGNAQRVVEVVDGRVAVRQDSFTKRNGVGNQVINTVGFQPVAVIFFWTYQTATGVFERHIGAGVGFATGPANQRAASLTALDGQGKSDNGRRRSESRVIIIESGGGPPILVAEAQLVSFDPTGFTLNWTTSDASPYRIQYIAFGPGITNAFAGTIDLANVAGAQTVNLAPAFQPDFVMFLWGFTGALDSELRNGELGVGFASSSTEEGALVYTGRDNSGPNTDKRWQQRVNANSSILILDPTTSPPSQDAIVDVTSFNVNGFTLNRVDPPATNNTPVFFLAMRGGRHRVGTFNQPNAIGNQIVNGLGFRSEQLMLASFGLVANAAIQPIPPANAPSGGISLGAAQSATTSGSIWFQDRSDNTTAPDRSDANMYTDTANVITIARGTAVSTVDGPVALLAQANLSSLDADGFTLKWTATDGVSRQILYWAMGPVERMDFQELF
ncbi:MAG: hypothetical protein ABIO65_12320 [Nitrospiria bacterium]